MGEATEWGGVIPSRRMGIKGTEQTGRIELRVENVAGYLITPGFVIIELHLNPVSVETIAEVNGRQIPSRDTSVFRLGVGAPTRNIGGVGWGAATLPPETRVRSVGVQDVSRDF